MDEEVDDVIGCEVAEEVHEDEEKEVGKEVWERYRAEFLFVVFVVDTEKEHPASMENGTTSNQQSEDDNKTHKIFKSSK